MNEDYYIKAVSALGLKYMDKKKDEVLVEFKTKNMRDKFSKCAKFLLYETGNKYDGGVGTKCVFAKGYIKIPKEYESSNEQYNKNFPFTIKCVIEKVVENHHQGFSIDMINKICPGLNFQPKPTRGGLYPINKTQFNALSAEMSEEWKKLF